MRIVIIFSTLAIAFGSHAAFAADTDADYEVPVSGSLSDAIRAANSNPDNDTYKIAISGSSTESGTIKKSTSITGDSTAAVSGYINFSGTGINSELNNMTFSAGNSPAVTNGEMGLGNAQNLTINSVVFDQRKGSGFGGSILNIGNLTIQNGSSFTNNKADYGGAIHHAGTSKTLNISNSSFSGNTATSSGGAINNTGILSVTDSVFEKNHGIYNGGAIITTGKTEIIRTTFNGNKASEGGAIHVGGNNGNLSISDSNFFNNETSINSQGTSDFGGAINAVGKLTINNSRFENNRSTEGGAIKLRQSSTETLITGGNFTKNSAVIRDGGAIDQSDGNLTIDGTIFVQNQSLAGDGGAIYTNSELTIKGNAEFSDNSAKTNGGAINAISNSKLNIDGASFSKNHADNGNGGALRIMGNTVLGNTVFSENRALKGGGIMNSGFLTIAGGTSFIDNKAADGGAVYTQGNILLDTTGGNISFRGNQADNAGGADIYLDPDKNVRIDIEGNGNALSMDSGFSGKGKIYKTGANTLIFEETADNTFFTGDFSQSAGTTHVFADNFFGGTNTVTDGSILHFNKTAQVNNLHLKNGGRLDLRRNGAFAPNTLTVADLISDGSAVVALQTNGTVSDLLKITGTAAGDITLDIDAVGTNPTKNKIEVVETSGAAGDAEFKLSGDKLDIGAHEYDLVHEQDANWYLETEGNLTKTAKSVEGIPALHLSIVNAGLNELRKRMGDLRSSNPNTPAGVWIRGYGKHLRIHEKIGARMDILGMEGGFDMMADMLGGRTYLGAMGGYLSSDNIRVLQTNASDAKGHTQTPVAGLYATWLHDDTKWFVDLTARHYWVQTDLNNIRSNDDLNGYDVKRNFWTFSAETGRLFETEAPAFINSGQSRISVEPKLELRYIRGNSKDFTTKTGDKGFIDSTHSLVTRFNVQTSYLPNGTNSQWKLFVELGLYNEWLGKTKIKFADVNLTTSDLSGLGFETSLGFNANLSEDAYWYGALTLEAGKAYTSYQFNTGLRVTF